MNHAMRDISDHAARHTKLTGLPGRQNRKKTPLKPGGLGCASELWPRICDALDACIQIYTYVICHIYQSIMSVLNSLELLEMLSWLGQDPLDVPSILDNQWFVATPPTVATSHMRSASVPPAVAASRMKSMPSSTALTIIDNDNSSKTCLPRSHRQTNSDSSLCTVHVTDWHCF